MKWRGMEKVFLSLIVCSNALLGGVGLAQAAEPVETSIESSAVSAVESNRASSVVISEFYAGGSNLASTDLIYKNDFVELFNPTSETIDLSGWSLQYADAKKTNWQSVPLQGSIMPYGFYLIALKDNSGPNAATLPAPDVSDTSLDLNNNKGKIALMRVTASGNAALPEAGHVVNYVCYGKASDLNADECPAGQPVAEAGQKNTLQRHVFNPLNPDAGLEAVDFPLSGNDWNTGEGALDFAKKSAGNPHNAATVALQRVYALSSQTVQMDSLTQVSSDRNTIRLDLVHGFLKAAPLYGTDYEIAGLPQGLAATATADAAGMTIEFTGEADGSVLLDSELSITLFDSIWAAEQPAAARPAELNVQTGSYTLQLKAAVEDPAIAGQTGAATSLRWNADRKGLAEENDSLVIELTSGTPRSGLLAPESYTLAGLPDGLESEAIGDAQNKTVTIQLKGVTAAPVFQTSELTVVLQPSAVQEAGRTASKPFAATIQSYVDDSTVRKEEMTSIIKQSNSYYMNAIMKAFKYSSETQGLNTFNFYRGTPELFYEDMGTSRMPLPASWSSLDSLKTWIEGDAHLQNVGVYNNGVFSGSDTNRKGETIFGLNDFDSAYIAPFYWDLLRMIPSLYMERDQGKAGSEMAMTTNADMRGVAGQFLDNYYKAMKDIAGGTLALNTELNAANVEPGFTKQLLEQSALIAREVNIADETSSSADGRAFKLTKKSGNKYWTLTPDARADFEQSWLSYAASVADGLPQEIKDNKNYFKIKDVVYRINQGNASIGSKRYNVLIEGPSANWEDDILLDVKEQFLPDMFQKTSNADLNLNGYMSEYAGNHAQRAVDAYRILSVKPEPFLGVMELDGQSLMVKAIPVSKNDYVDFLKDGAFGKQSDMADYLKYTAQAFALAHARSGESVSQESFAEQLTDAMNAEQWEAFKQQLIYVSESYYLQVKSDFGLMKTDLQAGNLLDIRHLKELTIREGSSDEGTVLNPAFTTMHPYPSYDEQWPNLAFELAVQPGTEFVTIAATAEDAKGLVAIGGQAAEEGKSVREIDVRELGQVTITVTARDQSTFTYTVTVNKQAEQDREDVAADKLALAVGYSQGDRIDHVTGNISLPQAGAHGTTVQWASSDSAVSISGATGIVTRPSFQTGDVKATLTATIKKGTATDTKVFELTVLKRQDTSGGGSNSGNQGGSGTGPQVTPSPSPTPAPTPGNGGNAGATPAPTPAPEVQAPPHLTDMEGHWAKTAVERAAGLGVIAGYTNGSFQPDKPVTRAEFIVMLARLSKWEPAKANSAFSDQDRVGGWAANAIAAAVERGVIAGYKDGSFRPNEAVTRAEMLVMLARSEKLAYDANATSGFSDDDAVPAWAKGAVGAGRQLGIIQGRGNNTFAPHESATRAEAAVLLLKLLDARPAASVE